MARPPLFIDGRRLTPHATGVGRYLSLLLETWATDASSLPFEPVVILHRDRPLELDPWKAVFRSETISPRIPGWLWENFALAAASRRRGALLAPANLVPHRWMGPVVLVVHDTFCEHDDTGISPLNRLRFRGRYRRSACRADLILTPSASTANDVRKYFGIPAHRVRVVRPGLKPLFCDDDPQGKPILDTVPSHQPYVLFVGKVSGRRGFPAIAEAVRGLVESGKPMKLVRVGPPLVHTLDTPHTIDLGHVSDTRLCSLYRNALALVWPSLREGFGLPVLEAMANGCPVVTTPRNALSELADGCCLAIDEASPDSIAAAIVTLTADESRRRMLIAAGYGRASQYDARSFANRVADETYRVIERNRVA